MVTAQSYTLAILSDIHYVGAAERACTDDYKYRTLPNPLRRPAVRADRQVNALRYGHKSLPCRLEPSLND